MLLNALWIVVGVVLVLWGADRLTEGLWPWPSGSACPR